MKGARERPSTPASGEPGPEAGSVEVRPVRPEDVPRLWEMLRGLAEYEELTDILTGAPELLAEALFGQGPHLEGLGAEESAVLIGYALFYPAFGSFCARWRLWLEDLYVEPSRRDAGVGGRLLAELSRIALAGGFYSVDWEVLDRNQPAIDFYARLGSRRIAADWFRYRLDGEALEALAEKRGA